MNISSRKIRCQGCGATLPVPDGLRDLNCHYCGAGLEVLGDRAATRTRPPDGIAGIEDKLAAMDARMRLQAMDAAWGNYVAAVSSKDANGRLLPPSRDEAVGLAVLGTVVTGGAAFLAYGVSWWLVPAVGAAGWLLTRHFYRMSIQRCRAFEAMRASYDARREELAAGLGTRKERGGAGAPR